MSETSPHYGRQADTQPAASLPAAAIAAPRLAEVVRLDIARARHIRKLTTQVLGMEAAATGLPAEVLQALEDPDVCSLVVGDVGKVLHAAASTTQEHYDRAAENLVRIGASVFPPAHVLQQLPPRLPDQG